MGQLIGDEDVFVSMSYFNHGCVEIEIYLLISKECRKRDPSQVKEGVGRDA